MTTIPASSARERLTAFLENGATYQFLHLADAFLHACPDDDYIRLMAIREYLKLGLVQPARMLLEEVTGSPESATEFARLRQSLDSVRGGSLDWSQAHETFQRNLASWHRRDGAAELVENAWRKRQQEFQWFRGVDRIDQIRMKDSTGRRIWIPYFGHHAAVDDARPLPVRPGELTPGPFLFDGLDLGHFFRRVYDATKKTFLGFSCALLVVEPDPALVAVVLHLHDWRDILADPRVYWFVGPEYGQRLGAVWDRDTDLPFPRQAFRLSQFRVDGRPTPVEIVQTAGAAREAELKASFQELEGKYSGRDACFWARRFGEALDGKGEPLRILSTVSIHTTFLQHSIRDAKRAFESLGHRCVVLTETQDHTIVGPLSYHRAIREFDPDLFFVLDHIRPEFEMLIPANLPVLTWDQDNLPHVFTAARIGGVAAWDFLVGCSKGGWLAKGGRAEQFLQARLPTCPEQFGGPPLSDEEMARYTCDVSYVSHASQTPRAFHEQERTRCANERLARLLDAIFEQLPDVLKVHGVAGGPVAEAVIACAEQRCGMTVADAETRSWLKDWYIWRLGDRIFRHEALEWVGRWALRSGKTFRLYGNGWEHHATLGRFAAGPAENGRPLLCIYRASRINLQLMPAGFIHQRALDGLAAGGFFLTRRVPGDCRAAALRRLEERIARLGIATHSELVKCTDPDLHALVDAYYGAHAQFARKFCPDLLQDIRLAGELDHPDEVFPRFMEIAFASEGQFGEIADRFLSDEGLRAQVANAMREVVLRRFTYRAGMDRFLRAMGTYLSDVTRRISQTASADR